MILALGPKKLPDSLAAKPKKRRGKKQSPTWAEDVRTKTGTPFVFGRGAEAEATREHYYEVLLDVRAECQRRGWEFTVVMREAFERWLARPIPPSPD